MREAARFATASEAEVALSFLIAHGIDALMPDRNVATVKPILQTALGGIRILAPDDQVESARELLADVAATPFAAAETPRSRVSAADGVFQLITGLAVLMTGNGYPGRRFRRSRGQLDWVQITGLVLLGLLLATAIATIVVRGVR